MRTRTNEDTDQSGHGPIRTRTNDLSGVPPPQTGPSGVPPPQTGPSGVGYPSPDRAQWGTPSPDWAQWGIDILYIDAASAAGTREMRPPSWRGEGSWGAAQSPRGGWNRGCISAWGTVWHRQPPFRRVIIGCVCVS